MQLDGYQEIAHRTEATVRTAGSDMIVPILGLAGEAGELLNESRRGCGMDTQEYFTERWPRKRGEQLP